MSKLAFLAKAKSFGTAVIAASKKKSPEIFLVVAGVGVIGGTVMASKATLKAPEIIEDAKEQLAVIDKCQELGYTAENEEYTDADARKDTTTVYAKTGVKLLKNYAPSIIFISTAFVSMIGSYKVLKHRNAVLSERNAELLATCTALSEGFKEYRKRVIDKFGTDVDNQIRFGLKEQEVEEEVLDKNGKKKQVKKTKEQVYSELAGSDLTCSPYARFFDPCSAYYEKDPQANMAFLKGQLQHFNNRLHSHKGAIVFLNDVYEALGFEKTKAGQVVGWVNKDGNKDGDNYISFDIYNVKRPSSRAFVNGYESVVLLDFNVDGVVVDQLPELSELSV